MASIDSALTMNSNITMIEEHQEIDYFSKTLHILMAEMKQTLQHEIEWCDSLLVRKGSTLPSFRSFDNSLDRIEELTELLDAQSTHIVDQISSTSLQTTNHSYIL